MTPPASAAVALEGPAAAAELLKPGDDGLDKYRDAQNAVASRLLEHIERYVITTQGDADAFSTWLVEHVVTPRKAAEELLDPLCSDANKLHKKLTTLRGAVVTKYAVGEEAGKNKLTAWVEAEERKRKEALAAAEAHQQQEEDDVRLQLAAEAEEDGDAEQAEAILNGDVPLMPVVPAVAAIAAPTRVAGMNFPRTYKATLVNRTAFVKDLLAQPELLASLFTPKVLAEFEKGLTKRANALGGIMKIGGVTVTEVTGARMAPRR